MSSESSGVKSEKYWLRLFPQPGLTQITQLTQMRWIEVSAIVEIEVKYNEHKKKEFT